MPRSCSSTGLAASEALTRGGSLVLARDKVEEVLPVARRALPLSASGTRRARKLSAPVSDEARQLVLTPQDGAGEQIGEAVRVAGDEVDRAASQTHIVQQLA